MEQKVVLEPPPVAVVRNVHAAVDAGVDDATKRRQAGPPAARRVSDEIVDLAGEALARLRSHGVAASGEVDRERPRSSARERDREGGVGTAEEDRIPAPPGDEVDLRRGLAAVRNEAERQRDVT